MRPAVSVILPAYNEEALIERTLERVKAELVSLEARYDWEIVAVDDGSSDRTGAIIDAFAAGEPRVQALHHRVNTNLGHVLRDGFNASRGDYVVTLDSDLSYGPEHIGRLVDAIIATEADIVIASPYAEGGQVTRCAVDPGDVRAAAPTGCSPSRRRAISPRSPAWRGPTRAPSCSRST